MEILYANLLEFSVGNLVMLLIGGILIYFFGQYM